LNEACEILISSTSEGSIWKEVVEAVNAAVEAVVGALEDAAVVPESQALLMHLR
jgi:hypothetical protein